jgi:hypothetical protein
VPYTPDKPKLAETSEQLRARIPGWGADLDPKDRPSVPRLQLDPSRTGAHWEFPERQDEKYPRERSMEHAFVTPVFGTAQPLKGLSGVIRRYSYKRFSEGRAAHWLLLIAADRVDVVESNVASIFQGKPDNPITETGVLSELKAHGLSSRVGQKRADVNHQWMDPVIVAAPWVAAGAGAVAAVRRLRRTA